MTNPGVLEERLREQHETLYLEAADMIEQLHEALEYLWSDADLSSAAQAIVGDALTRVRGRPWLNQDPPSPHPKGPDHG